MGRKKKQVGSSGSQDGHMSLGYSSLTRSNRKQFTVAAVWSGIGESDAFAGASLCFHVSYWQVD